MNAAPILWSGADRFGREARAGDGGALGGPGWSGAGVEHNYALISQGIKVGLHAS